MSIEPLSQRILLAEDSPSQMAYLQKILSAHFPTMEMILCATGKEALSRLKEKGIALIIMSFRLPDMSGLELLKRIRKEVPQVPIIMMTAEISSKVVLDVMRGGAYDYIPKTKEGLKVLPLVVEKGLKKHQMVLEKEVFYTEQLRLIQELRKINGELLKAQEELVKAERKAVVGLLSMSHKINAPVAPIIGFGELLAQRNDLPQDVHQQILKIHRSSLRIQNIIEKLTNMIEEKTNKSRNNPFIELY